MGTPRRWTQDDTDRLVELHTQGHSRNDIATTMGWATGTITAKARDAGLTFDRADVEAATRARQIDLKARRAALELTLLEDAEKLRAQIWQPHTYIDHGGKDFVRVEWQQDEPTPTDKLKLMQATGQAIDRSLKIAAVQAETGDEPVKALLVTLGQSLGIIPPNTEESS